MGIFRRAASDTRSFLGGWRAPVLFLLTSTVSLSVHARLFGVAAMREEVAPYLSAIITYLAVVMLIFAGNVIAAPFRNERDRNKKLAVELAALGSAGDANKAAIEDLRSANKELSNPKPRLVMDLTNFVISIISDRQMAVTVMVRLANQGTASSATDHWNATITLPDGRVPKSGILPVTRDGSVTNTTPRGESFRVPAEELRLRTHSQNSTVAARAMADRKTVGHRS